MKKSSYIEEAPQLELKPLPGGPKYEYLGPGKLKPRWDGPVLVREVFNHGAVVVRTLEIVGF